MLTPLVTTLIGRQKIAEQTYEIELERPEGFEFQAGQHVNLKLTEQLFEDKKGARRTFTLASAPHENKLLIATRMTGSGFKKTVIDGAAQSVEIIGPLGTMVRDESKPAVFIAGGIGITPFRSMVLDAQFRNIEHHMTLFYSNRTLASAAYFDLFLDVAKNLQNFTFIPTITKNEPQDESWTGESRYIDVDFIKEYVPHLSDVIFYISGPPIMVSAVTASLKNDSTIRQGQILSETFWGY